MSSLKIQLEQINFTVGDLEGNYKKIIYAYQQAITNQADLVVFSELATTGYFPEDLLQKEYFVNAVEDKVKELIVATKNQKTAILLGTPYFATSSKQSQNLLYNAAFLIVDGQVEVISHKNTLPNYGIFDERRYFTPGITLSTTKFRDFNLAILICEDIWNIKNSFLLAEKKIDIILVINASPFSEQKAERRLEIVNKFVKSVESGVVYVNQVGGQDSVIFDGRSFVVDSKGYEILSMAEFEEDSSIINLNKEQKNISIEVQSQKSTKSVTSNQDQEQRIYNALTLGLRDYVKKNGFQKVLIGMSGGIDSALTAVIAVDALGSENVDLIALPSQYNSKTSLVDAKQCAENLGINLKTISIEPFREMMLQSLEQYFLGQEDKTVVEENLQSRLRGVVLMALSNQSGGLLITTGNKSEMATGYATLYGDMCGAYNPLKDVYKTKVFKLAKWRNHNSPAFSCYPKVSLIPVNIINKEPSAELRFNQKDSDSLPDYLTLDAILFNLIEEQKSVMATIALGFNEDAVQKVAKLLYSSEYKRRQSVIGPKISQLAFDKDRRYPITNKFLT